MILTPLNKLYPPRLRNIPDAPAILYLKTKLGRRELANLWEKPAVAVVGTRRMSAYGKKMTENFVRQLTEKGIVIVSGMAAGIDGVAHRTAIENHGQTIAVLGSGLDIIYPKENQDIWEKADVVLSEFSAGTRPLAKNFPRRNRIISGLSEAVLVVEAAKKSGSMITARLAAEQGKEVLAVPGRIDIGLSDGTNFLISQGAKPASCVEDILEELSLE